MDWQPTPPVLPLNPVSGVDGYRRVHPSEIKTRLAFFYSASGEGTDSKYQLLPP